MILKGWRDELKSIVAPGFDPAGQVLKPEGWKPKSCKKPN
jgi:predicted HAD superfamily Cof-like phosphohydrolase